MTTLNLRDEFNSLPIHIQNKLLDLFGKDLPLFLTPSITELGRQIEHLELVGKEQTRITGRVS